MARTYAAVPHEYYEEMAELTDEEFGRLIRALLRYSMTGEQGDLPGSERYFFKRVIHQEDRHQKSYEEQVEKWSAAGKKAAQARWDRERELRSDAIAYNNKNKTKTNIYSNARSSEDERRFEERLHKDVVELERFLKEVGEP